MQRELPARKNIRLKDYDYSTAGYYFITICVKDKHEMLGKVCVGDDAHIVPPYIEHSDYGKIVVKYIENINISYDDISVDNYVVMPNHVHMLIVIKQDNGGKDNGRKDNGGTMWASSPTAARIPGVIRSLKTLVAKECGFSFWQRSYHDRIIRNEEDYQRIWQYIDENPARWAEDDYFVKPTAH
ncbi:MAG: transposase [Oscillospiraceae bacterium]|nr:transposase [Oscillospiraceae bacterium]